MTAPLMTPHLQAVPPYVRRVGLSRLETRLQFLGGALVVTLALAEAARRRLSAHCGGRA